MGNPFRKLPAHSPVTAISITAYNRMIDMLNWWQSRGPLGGGQVRGLADWDQSVFKVKNSTGYDLLSYDPVGLDGPLITPTDNEQEFENVTALEGVEPTVAAHAGCKWGVMLEAAGNGSIGRCCFAGVVPVRVYVTAAADAYVDVIAAETVGTETVYLGTGATGAQILWLEDDTIETIVWAIVRLGATPTIGVRFYVGTTTGAVTSDTDFTVSGLTAIDGGSVPDPDNTGPDTWDVSNAIAEGDGYAIDASKVGKIIGWSDGTLHPLDFPCPE